MDATKLFQPGKKPNTIALTPEGITLLRVYLRKEHAYAKRLYDSANELVKAGRKASSPTLHYAAKQMEFAKAVAASVARMSFQLSEWSFNVDEAFATDDCDDARRGKIYIESLKDLGITPDMVHDVTRKPASGGGGGGSPRNARRRLAGRVADTDELPSYSDG